MQRREAGDRYALRASRLVVLPLALALAPPVSCESAGPKAIAPAGPPATDQVQVFDVLRRVAGEERSRVGLRVRGTPPPGRPIEVRLQFEFDSAPPEEVLLILPDGDVESDIKDHLRLERRGPASWRVTLDADFDRAFDGEVEVEWTAPASGARLDEARWTTPEDDARDRPQQFYEDLETIRALYPGNDATSKARRFFLELDFVTRLMQSGFLKSANQGAAEQELDVPEAAFLAEPSNIQADLHAKVIERPIGRARASVLGGTTIELEELSGSDAESVSCVALAFESLATRHFPNAATQERDVALAFLSFANGSLRRGPASPDARTDSELSGAFNCEPDGHVFLAFAEFAMDAIEYYETNAPDSKERAFWRSFWVASVAGIEVFGDVYRDRAKGRSAAAYSPDTYAAERAWSDPELAKLFERSTALDDEQVGLLWGRSLISLLRDDPRMTSSE